MGLKALDPVAYAKLLASELPKPIANDKEFDRMVERLEELDFPDHSLTREEKALRELLAADAHPHEILQQLMEQRDLKQADLVPVIGTRAQVSDMVNGKRGISKAQAKKLAEYFRVSAELFI